MNSKYYIPVPPKTILVQLLSADFEEIQGLLVGGVSVAQEGTTWTFSNFMGIGPYVFEEGTWVKLPGPGSVGVIELVPDEMAEYGFQEVDGPDAVYTTESRT